MVAKITPCGAATASALGSTTSGLSEAEALQRLKHYGPNVLVEHKVGVLERLGNFFWGPIPWMIEVAAILSAVLGHWENLAIILTMLFVNAGVGFWQEYKADNAIALLRSRLALKARVKRDSRWKDIGADQLAPGDVVQVNLGNIVPADLKLTDGAFLSVDQSALNGESLPVDKKVGDDAYSGSIARQGEMSGVVVATGQVCGSMIIGLKPRRHVVCRLRRVRRSNRIGARTDSVALRAPCVPSGERRQDRHDPPAGVTRGTARAPPFAHRGACDPLTE